MATEPISTKTDRQPICPSLPTEIWITVLSHHSDLLHLWTTCRLVSRSLRACAERAFPLHEMEIHFQLEKYNLGGKSKRPEVPVTFDRISSSSSSGRKRSPKSRHGDEEEKTSDNTHDIQIAWFRDKRSRSDLLSSDHGIAAVVPKSKPKGPGARAAPKKVADRQQEIYNRIISRWEENILWPKPELPNYTISLREMVNDTALPGLELDRNERAVSFEWRRAVGLFLREEGYVRRLERESRRRGAIKVQADAENEEGERETGEDGQAEERSSSPVPADECKESAGRNIDIRLQARRARLKEWYKDDEMMCWAIDSLKHFEAHGSSGTGTTRAMKVDLNLPGAGLGERWWGRTNVVQELYLDEWSCMQRIEQRREALIGEK